MGVLKFKLPAGLQAADVQELQRASVAGPQDYMPFPSAVAVNADHMTISRRHDESGLLAVPWQVNGAGRLMFLSATLMEREQPYRLAVEIARGKLNQLRVQICDWEMNGIPIPGELHKQLLAATRHFGKAAMHLTSPHADACAQQALAQGCVIADRLVDHYVEQIFAMRHERYAQLSTLLGCRVNGVPANAVIEAQLKQACTTVWLPFRWAAIEPEEKSFNWEQVDALVDWAVASGLQIIGGPLLDFYGADWPDWLWQGERSLANVGSFFSEYVERVVQRFRSAISTWHVTASSNLSPGLSVGDEELLWLTLRAAEAARQVNPAFQIIVGISQPWGEYLAGDERTHSPFAFADTLIRTGLKLAALELEVVMGVAPRGSYCRDRLEFSRILDLYALLGVPLQVTLGYPSATAADAQADFRLSVGAGACEEGVSSDAQAFWARQFTQLVLCKPYVRSACWTHLHDGRPHDFPNCGLVDADNHIKPAFEKLIASRQEHLSRIY